MAVDSCKCLQPSWQVGRRLAAKSTAYSNFEEKPCANHNSNGQPNNKNRMAENEQNISHDRAAPTTYAAKHTKQTLSRQPA